jgi:hypothetical protein
LPHARLSSQGFPRFNASEPVSGNPNRFIEGYPIPLSKKTCAGVVTYRQCADQHFEKTPHLLKRKDFMKIFLSSRADYDRALRISIRRADSVPCPRIAKVAALFCGREANSVGIRIPCRAVARKIRRAIT